MNIHSRFIKILLFTFIGCKFSLAQSVSKNERNITERKQIAMTMEQSLKHDLLDIYYPRSLDTVYGGFLSTFTYDFKPTGSQEKMIVTQSRHTWTNSKAGLRYPEKLYYRKDATAGFHFLANRMWDKQYGGFYTLVTRKGEIPPGDPADKTAYGNAFGIYALAAYYQLTGDETALALAKKTFYWLEVHSHDSLHKGYFQQMKRDGEPIGRTSNTAVIAETGYKDQNSSIHLLEASQVLGFKNDSITLMTGKKLVDHALKNGWDASVGGFYDEGFYFKGDTVITILKESKNWWAQAEGLNSLLLMSDYFPGDPHHYFDKFKTLWTYTQTYLIDHQWGDWYDEGLDKSPQRKTALKSQIWKATYHNYRSLSNCVDRLNDK